MTLALILGIIVGGAPISALLACVWLRNVELSREVEDAHSRASCYIDRAVDAEHKARCAMADAKGAAIDATRAINRIRERCIADVAKAAAMFREWERAEMVGKRQAAIAARELLAKALGIEPLSERRARLEVVK